MQRPRTRSNKAQEPKAVPTALPECKVIDLEVPEGHDSFQEISFWVGPAVIWITQPVPIEAEVGWHWTKMGIGDTILTLGGVRAAIPNR